MVFREASRAPPTANSEGTGAFWVGYHPGGAASSGGHGNQPIRRPMRRVGPPVDLLTLTMRGPRFLGNDVQHESQQAMNIADQIWTMGDRALMPQSGMGSASIGGYWAGAIAARPATNAAMLAAS